MELLSSPLPPSPPSGRFFYGRHGEVRGKIRIKSLNGINVAVDALGFICFFFGKLLHAKPNREKLDVF